MKTKVVVIGGGNGSAIVINALKKFVGQLEVAAVISMSDSGGSSGRLRQEFGGLPPGDILRAVLALSPYDYHWLRNIFYRTRFTGDGKLTGHNLGNLFLTLGSNYAKDFMSGVRALEEAVSAVGHAYPITLEPSDLCAELRNGMIVKTEAALDDPTYDRTLKIKRVWLEPEVKIYSEAQNVIQEADYIFLSPGSLYTSVIATLLPGGVKEAIDASKAKLIYVAGDAYEQNGETGPERLSDFVSELESYLPRPIDTVIYHDLELTPRQRQRFEERKWGAFAKNIENIKNQQIVGADFEKDEGGLSPEKLSKILGDILDCHSERSVA
ncbi:MAG: YvcK family protein [Candidatus Magasanikbacteria bacterium]|nr:YvcK family protein [Candidatus Magasanikbacteria bacterium]